ncbi:MAG: hypothetical protein ACK5MA_01060 [Parachlamydiaceae bacterium]
MKKSLVLLSTMGLLFAGCEMEGHKEHKDAEKNGQMTKDAPANMGNGQQSSRPNGNMER